MKIEAIVGTVRDKTQHIGKYFPETGTLYILHSSRCKGEILDSRNCLYSVALDVGMMTQPYTWERVGNGPAYLDISGGYLKPTTRVEEDSNE